MIRARRGADTLLFRGHRDATADALYDDEWPAVPGLAVDVAVSRHADPAMRRRVTAALRARGAEVCARLLAADARVFVAGNAQMATDVTAVLLDVLAEHGPGLDAKRAAAVLRKLEREGRFAVEGYG